MQFVISWFQQRKIWQTKYHVCFQPFMLLCVSESLLQLRDWVVREWATNTFFATRIAKNLGVVKYVFAVHLNLLRWHRDSLGGSMRHRRHAQRTFWSDLLIRRTDKLVSSLCLSRMSAVTGYPAISAAKLNANWTSHWRKERNDSCDLIRFEI